MFVTLYKYQLKWSKNLNIIPKISKLVQARTEHTLEAIGIGIDFLNRTQIAQQLRDKIDKMVLQKLKCFAQQKKCFVN
jgi:hypothetical protein